MDLTKEIQEIFGLVLEPLESNFGFPPLPAILAEGEKIVSNDLWNEVPQALELKILHSQIARQVNRDKHKIPFGQLFFLKEVTKALFLLFWAFIPTKLGLGEGYLYLYDGGERAVLTMRPKLEEGGIDDQDEFLEELLRKGFGL